MRVHSVMFLAGRTMPLALPIAVASGMVAVADRTNVSAWLSSFAAQTCDREHAQDGTLVLCGPIYIMVDRFTSKSDRMRPYEQAARLITPDSSFAGLSRSTFRSTYSSILFPPLGQDKQPLGSGEFAASYPVRWSPAHCCVAAEVKLARGYKLLPCTPFVVKRDYLATCAVARTSAARARGRQQRSGTMVRSMTSAIAHSNDSLYFGRLFSASYNDHTSIHVGSSDVCGSRSAA